MHDLDITHAVCYISRRDPAGPLPLPRMIDICILLCYSHLTVTWTFITSHGRVLLAVAADPRRTIREIAAEVRLTERATHRVISGLTEAGYLERLRLGRRVHYRLNLHQLQQE